MSAGGVEVILAAVRAHVGNVDVSHWACRALANLAFYDANKVVMYASTVCGLGMLVTVASCAIWQ